jgi:hypothetical protein
MDNSEFSSRSFRLVLFSAVCHAKSSVKDVNTGLHMDLRQTGRKIVRGRECEEKQWRNRGKAT